MTESPTPSTSRHHDDKCDKPEKPDKAVLLVSDLTLIRGSCQRYDCPVGINLTNSRTLVTIFSCHREIFDTICNFFSFFLTICD